MPECEACDGLGTLYDTRTKEDVSCPYCSVLNP